MLGLSMSTYAVAWGAAMVTREAGAAKEAAGAADGPGAAAAAAGGSGLYHNLGSRVSQGPIALRLCLRMHLARLSARKGAGAKGMARGYDDLGGPRLPLGLGKMMQAKPK